MCGVHTVQPMGWDAFGLPAENAARERSLSASEWTTRNINQMHHQMSLLGLHFDHFGSPSRRFIPSCHAFPRNIRSNLLDHLSPLISTLQSIFIESLSGALHLLLAKLRPWSRSVNFNYASRGKLSSFTILSSHNHFERSASRRIPLVRLFVHYLS
jgi:hypothetical protein